MPLYYPGGTSRSSIHCSISTPTSCHFPGVVFSSDCGSTTMPRASCRRSITLLGIPIPSSPHFGRGHNGRQSNLGVTSSVHGSTLSSPPIAPLLAHCMSTPPAFLVMVWHDHKSRNYQQKQCMFIFTLYLVYYLLCSSFAVLVAPHSYSPR